MTERTQFLVLSSGYENNLGVESYQQYKSRYPRTSNEHYQTALTRVGNALKNVAEQDDFAWEFNVLECKQENAFCLPGGKVAVYSGLMPEFKNEAELACVVAHEVGHAIARHGGERMSWNYLTTIGSFGISRCLENATVDDIYALGSEYGVMLPFSRKHEYEADLIGMYLMAKAGYDPQAAIQFWTHFAKTQSSFITAMQSTHPCDQDRITHLSEHLEEARKLYRECKVKKGFGETLRYNGATATPAPQGTEQPKSEPVFDISI